MRQYKSRRIPKERADPSQPHMRICKCENCGKTYTQLEPTMWRYKYQSDYRVHNFCSYGCLQENRRKVIEDDRRKMVKVSGARGADASHIRDLLRVEKDESHTYDEWAEIYDVDVYKLWSMKNEMFMDIEDAILALLREKEYQCSSHIC